MYLKLFLNRIAFTTEYKLIFNSNALGYLQWCV